MTVEAIQNDDNSKCQTQNQANDLTGTAATEAQAAAEGHSEESNERQPGVQAETSDARAEDPAAETKAPTLPGR